MKHGSTVIAFVEDPDGYKVELIQVAPRQSRQRRPRSPLNYWAIWPESPLA
jgi:hypothetical protein